ncbi:MAG TPA: hypothetical protein VEZ89_03660 [Rubrivivax sp.]|nr:hypothetical protein [Rubrivivax sp.]
MYFSTSFSNSLLTAGATTIFIRQGNGTSTVPLTLNSRAVLFLLSVIFQLPPTSALPSPLTGVQTTAPLALLLTYSLA